MIYENGRPCTGSLTGGTLVGGHPQIDVESLSAAIAAAVRGAVLSGGGTAKEADAVADRAIAKEMARMSMRGQANFSRLGKEERVSDGGRSDELVEMLARMEEQ